MAACRPCLIIGSPRSGTNLLSRMLGAHPEVFSPPETLFFEHLSRWRAVYGDCVSPEDRNALIAHTLELPRLKWIGGLVTEDEVLANWEYSGLEGAFDSLLATLAERHAKKTWVESTPSHTFYAKRALEHLPELTTVHLLRDGRDVALSLQRARFGSATLPFAIRRWQRSVLEARSILESTPEKRALEIRYEDLVNNPEVELRKVCGLMGIEFSPAMLDYHKTHDRGPYFEKELSGLKRPAFTSSVGKWRKQLSVEEVRPLEQIASGTLRAVGYDCERTESAGLLTQAMWWLHELVLKPIRMASNIPGQREGLILCQLRLKQLVYASSKGRMGALRG